MYNEFSRRMPARRHVVTALVGIVVCASTKLGASVEPVDAATLELSFGVYQSDKASVMFAKFKPTIDALQDAMADRLDRPVVLKLTIYKSYEGARSALINGEVDFVRFGPASFVLAKRENRKIRLLAMESKGGGRRFKGAIVVRADSSFRELKDLKASRFAFGDKNSTIGRYLAQAELVGAGITAADLSGFDYLGRHDLVVKRVLLGDFDAGAAKMSTVKAFNKTGKLRVIKVFDNVTKPWIARSDLEDKLFDALQTSLLEFRDTAALKSLNASGFLPASDADYQSVQRGIDQSLRFEKVRSHE